MKAVKRTSKLDSVVRFSRIYPESLTIHLQVVVVKLLERKHKLLMIDRYRRYTSELKDFVRWSKEARGVVFINFAEAAELYQMYLADQYLRSKHRGISQIQNVLEKLKELEN